MSDESDDKTEAPTPHRLEKAREEGQIPRSRELTSLLILLVGVSVIWFGGVSLARRLSGMLSAGLHFDHSIYMNASCLQGIHCFDMTGRLQLYIRLYCSRNAASPYVIRRLTP
ncbi:EscU/YscU/HrcU family type III secretion system export apparatus switch protein, partial [Escherichia coli]